MRALNRTRQKDLISKPKVAKSSWARLSGLLGRKSLGPGDGLIMPRARVTLAPMAMGIHTIGMLFSIDVAFVDPSGRITRMIHSMKPYRISPLVWNCAMVLELPDGVLRESGSEVGDQIELIAGDVDQRKHGRAPSSKRSTEG